MSGTPEGPALGREGPPLTVCVVGLGKIGLPLAVQCAAAGGMRVIGCDIDASVVEAINRGETEIGEPGLAEALRDAVGAGTLWASTDTTAGSMVADVVIVIVPVAVTGGFEVDFRHIDSAAAAVGAGLRRGALVVFESTLPVGSTRKRLVPLLERGAELTAGVDFAVAFSPERVYSGRIFSDLATYPKVVGGIDVASTNRAAEFYGQLLRAPVLSLGSCEAAEYVKLVETTYRDVNIALANEFALYAERLGLDVGEVIAAANTQPFSHVHQPSVGVGGHCIPVYPYFLINSWDGFRIPPLARAINDGMAAHAVRMLEEALGTLVGQTVLILGLTYRENVKEVSFSSATKIALELRRRGATVLGHDPLLSDGEQRALGVQPVALDAVPEVAAIVLQAPHDAYRALDYATFSGLRAFLDGRTALEGGAVEALGAGGVRYLRVGLG